MPCSIIPSQSLRKNCISIHYLMIVSHGWRSLLHRLINAEQLLFPESKVQRLIHLIFRYLGFACVKLEKCPREYWINTLWSGPLTSMERSALELLENSLLPIYNLFFFHLKLKMDLHFFFFFNDVLLLNEIILVCVGNWSSQVWSSCLYNVKLKIST